MPKCSPVGRSSSAARSCSSLLRPPVPPGPAADAITIFPSASASEHRTPTGWMPMFSQTGAGRPRLRLVVSPRERRRIHESEPSAALGIRQTTCGDSAERPSGRSGLAAACRRVVGALGSGDPPGDGGGEAEGDHSQRRSPSLAGDTLVGGMAARPLDPAISGAATAGNMGHRSGGGRWLAGWLRCAGVMRCVHGISLGSVPLMKKVTWL
jgi:hypothetical protein